MTLDLKKKFVLLLIIVFVSVVQVACGGNISAIVPGLLYLNDFTTETKTRQGYLSVVYEGETFLAAGSNGRLDRISLDKSVKSLTVPSNDDFTCILKDSALTLVCGTSGAVMYSYDGESFFYSEPITNSDILAITSFKGEYFAATSAGEILISSDGILWNIHQLSNGVPIISICSNEQYIMAISKETDIFISSDGEKWDTQNFNNYYNGYYESYVFTKMMMLGDTFFVTGHLQNNPDVPFLMYTNSAGEVWLFKSLSEINGSDVSEHYPLTISSIGFFTDQIVATCDGGRLITITDCSECNLITNVSEKDLYDLALGGEFMLVVGADYAFDVIQSADFRQNKIKPAQALNDFVNGAIIIDVRTEDEYSNGHIKGALHIPVSEIAHRLPLEVADTQKELIFYCAAGSRSQTALETAQQLGYTKVYNLGSFSDWPYETE